MTRNHYHNDCMYFFSNGAVNYCGHTLNYKSCSSLKSCSIHNEQKKKEDIDWIKLIEEKNTKKSTA